MKKLIEVKNIIREHGWCMMTGWIICDVCFENTIKLCVYVGLLSILVIWAKSK